MGTAGGSLTLLARRRPLTGLSPTPPLPSPGLARRLPGPFCLPGGVCGAACPPPPARGGCRPPPRVGRRSCGTGLCSPPGRRRKRRRRRTALGSSPAAVVSPPPPLLLGLLRGSPGIRWAMGSFVLVQAGRPVALLGRR